MNLGAFELSRPGTVRAAVQALAAAGGEASFLAGGQTLLGSLRLGLAAPQRLVDLSRIDALRGIRVTRGALRVGAMTTHAEVAASAEVRAAIPALAALAAGIGDRAVRNLGTLGGSLANSDPAACYPAAVLGLGATIVTDRRRIAADDYFRGLMSTALEPGELITAVIFPVPQKAAYVKFHNPASRFALVGVFVSRRRGAGVRVAVTGAGPCAFRVPALEAALAAKWAPESCDGVTVSAAGLASDLHASAEYRAHLIPVLARRAVAAA
jgi:carbon-monoxide dehydrogenase medium subunit